MLLLALVNSYGRAGIRAVCGTCGGAVCGGAIVAPYRQVLLSHLQPWGARRCRLACVMCACFGQAGARRPGGADGGGRLAGSSGRCCFVRRSFLVCVVLLFCTWCVCGGRRVRVSCSRGACVRDDVARATRGTQCGVWLRVVACYGVAQTMCCRMCMCAAASSRATAVHTQQKVKGRSRQHKSTRPRQHNQRRTNKPKRA